jgi:hypothetical protein
MCIRQAYLKYVRTVYDSRKRAGGTDTLILGCRTKLKITFRVWICL